MRRRGWLIIIGPAPGAVHGVALDQLLNTMLTPPTDYRDVLRAIPRAAAGPGAGRRGPDHGPRIIRRGAEMDAELRATV